MTPKQFWHEDVGLFQVYQKAYLQNQAYSAYVIGARVCEATSLAIANAFRKEGSKPYEYTKEPPDIISEFNMTERRDKKEMATQKLRRMTSYWK